jgi:UrcA family protein
MTVAIRAILVAGAFACLSSGANAQDQKPVSIQVRYADLNLSSAAGQAALKARIRGAAEAACAEKGGWLDDKIDAARCRSAMMKDGQVQAARLAAAADQRLALADRR